MSSDSRQVSQEEACTMCAVCAWRLDCHKKYSYQQGGTIKCADYTRDVSLPREEPPEK